MYQYENDTFNGRYTYQIILRNLSNYRLSAN